MLWITTFVSGSLNSKKCKYKFVTIEFKVEYICTDFSLFVWYFLYLFVLDFYLNNRYSATKIYLNI